MAPPYRIVEDDLTGPEIAALLRFHFDHLRSLSPPESCHVLPVDQLRGPDVTFWSAWAADRLATCGPFGDYAPDPLSTFMTRTL